MKPAILKQGKTPKELGMEISAISIDLTERCNLRCTYCFADIGKDGSTLCKSADSENSDLTIELGKEIIDWFLSEDVSGKANESGNNSVNMPYRIDFWGGEPFLKFDLLRELFIYGQKKAEEIGKNVIWGGTTNATLLDEAKLNWLLPRNIHFLLSVDGIGERNRLRQFPDGSNSWETIQKNLKSVIKIYNKLKLKLPSIRLTPTPENVKGLADDVKSLNEMGFTDIFFSENYDSPWTAKDLKQYEEELNKLVDYRLKLLEKEEFFTSKFMDDISSFILNQAISGIKQPVNHNGRVCGAGNTFLGISIEGAIYPCHRFNKHNTRDVVWHEKKVCLGSIWEGITNENFLAEMKLAYVPYVSGDTSTIPHCKDCKVELSCLGGCYAAKYDYDETFTNNIGGLICDIRNIFYRVARREIDLAISNNLLGKYGDKINVKFMKQLQFMDLNIVNCACNMSGYANKSEMIENLIKTNKYNKEGKELEFDKLYLLTTMKNILENEIIYVSNNKDIPGCVCNNGGFNKDILLDQQKLDIDMKHKVVDTFIKYWGSKSE